MEEGKNLNKMIILVTKRPELYVYCHNTKKFTTKEIKEKGELVRFYLRIYNPGETAKYLKIRTLQSVPDKIDSNFFESLIL